MTSDALFDTLGETLQPFLLASHMPIGEVWRGCFDVNTNMGKLVKALSLEFERLQLFINTVKKELEVTKTDSLLDEWEKQVNIPDTCFLNDNTVSKSKRINQVFVKNGDYQGMQTLSDFIRISAIFDINTMVISRTLNTITINITGLTGSPATFPLPFPIPFFRSPVDFLRCMYEQILPANINVIVTV